MQNRDTKKRNGLQKGEYIRKNGTFEYKYVDLKGCRKSVYAKSKEDLRKKEIQIKRDLLDGIEHSYKTINDYYSRWKETKNSLKESTFRSYVASYDRYVLSVFGKQQLNSVRFSDVVAFYNRLSKDKGIKASTVEKCDVVLRQVFALAVRDNILRNNPVDGAIKELRRTPENSSKVIKALTVKQQEMFEEFLLTSDKFRNWYPIFEFLLWSGVRVGEGTGLTWHQVDMKSGKIFVKYTLSYFDKGDGKGSSFSISSPKTRYSIRKIPLFEPAKNALAMLSTSQSELGIRCESVIDGQSDFVLINSKGKVYSYKKLNDALYRIADAINEKYGLCGEKAFPRISCHVLRHTLASRMHEAGFSDIFISRYLGHKDIETTTGVYIDIDFDREKELISNFGKKAVA